MTTVYPDPTMSTGLGVGVYPPQHDSLLLIAALRASGVAASSRVADLCTGSGVVAVAAAAMGARAVSAFDICPIAVSCARTNTAAAGDRVNVSVGSWTRAHAHMPFDVVLANPPYVPAGPTAEREPIPASAGPARAWNAGPDGRMILDPLCDSASDLLADGGTLLLVQSEFADIEQSVRRLRSTGLSADVVATEFIPFGPVMRARAGWLERTGRLPRGRRTEKLSVIRADKA